MEKVGGGGELTNRACASGTEPNHQGGGSWNEFIHSWAERKQGRGGFIRVPLGTRLEFHWQENHTGISDGKVTGGGVLQGGRQSPKEKS